MGFENIATIYIDRRISRERFKLFLALITLFLITLTLTCFSILFVFLFALLLFILLVVVCLLATLVFPTNLMSHPFCVIELLAAAFRMATEVRGPSSQPQQMVNLL